MNIINAEAMYFLTQEPSTFKVERFATLRPSQERFNTLTMKIALIPPFLLNSAPLAWLDNWAGRTAAKVLTTGVIPQHVALIMDGNRRYAKKRGLPTAGGHEAGSMSLLQTVDASLFLGLRYLTIYAFSIENFNRSHEEVDLLFTLLVDKLNVFLDNSQKLNRSVRVRIIGNKSLIPQDTLVKLEDIERLTSVNKKLVLNVCFAYTSRDEISHSMCQVVSDVLDDQVAMKQIDEKIISDNFYFGSETPPVDLLIRTSGHTRLSDFLIWQVSEHAEIVFLNVYWPDFTAAHFYCILVKYGFNRFFSTKLQDIKAAAFTTEEYASKRVDVHSLPAPPPLVSVLGPK